MQFNLVNDQEQLLHSLSGVAWRGVALRGVALALGFVAGGA